MNTVQQKRFDSQYQHHLNVLKRQGRVSNIGSSFTAQWALDNAHRPRSIATRIASIAPIGNAGRIGAHSKPMTTESLRWF